MLKNLVQGGCLLNVQEGEDPLSWARFELRGSVTRMIPAEKALEEGSSYSLIDEILLVPQAEKIQTTSLPPLGKLCFLASGMKKNHPLYVQMKERSKLIDFSLESKSQRRERFAKEIGIIAQESGKKMDSQAINKLLELSTEDVQVYVQEVHKLALYVGEKERIEASDVSCMIAHTKEETLWHFCDALLEKKAQEAEKIGKKLLTDLGALPLLLRSVRGQLQQELQVASLALTGDLNGIQRLFPYMKGKILEIHLNTAKRIGVEGLKRAIATVDEMDFHAKNGVEEAVLLSMLIAKVIYDTTYPTQYARR